MSILSAVRGSDIVGNKFRHDARRIQVLLGATKREDLPVKMRLILTNTSLVVLGLLVAQMPGVSQGQKPAAQKTTTESGWYKYGQPLPDLKGPAPKLPNGKPSMAGLWSQTRRADVTNPKVQPGHVDALPYTAWGKRQWDNYDVFKHGDYAGSCMPFGWSRTLFGPHPVQIVQ